MALRKILTQEDPVLRKKSREVVNFGKRTGEILDDMTETLLRANGLGLAAPQVGILRRMYIMIKDGEPFEVLNPEIVSSEGENAGMEGCLSCPGLQGYVTRPETVTVRAQDRNGNPIEITCTGIEARCCCHEIDHLDGILYLDRADEVYSDEEDEE